jgi:hypothetical protein
MNKEEKEVIINSLRGALGLGDSVMTRKRKMRELCKKETFAGIGMIIIGFSIFSVVKFIGTVFIGGGIGMILAGAWYYKKNL